MGYKVYVKSISAKIFWGGTGVTCSFIEIAANTSDATGITAIDIQGISTE